VHNAVIHKLIPASDEHEEDERLERSRTRTSTVTSKRARESPNRIETLRSEEQQLSTAIAKMQEEDAPL
jgi:predicted RNase H-like nuclease (RuvC/YqgF family)